MDGGEERELVHLAPDECWTLLGERGVGRLGVVVDGEPVVVPVNYVVDDNAIVFRTDPRSRIAGALVGMPTAFEVDWIDHDAESGWSVLVRGRAVEVREPDVLHRIGGSGPRPWAPGPRTRIMRITPSSVTGRRLLHGAPAGLWWG